MGKFFQKVHNDILHKIVDVTLFSVTIYFVFRKTTNFTITATLKKYTTAEGAEIIITFLIIYLIFISTIKAFQIFIKKSFEKDIDVSEYIYCILNTNKETITHYDNYDRSLTNKESYLNYHKYDRNIALIIDSLEKSIMNYFDGISKKEGDIFISVYDIGEPHSTNKNKAKELHYIYHTNDRSHSVNTKVIDIEKEHQSFACTQGFKRNKIIYYYKIKKNTYIIDDIERRKTIKNYIGFPVCFDKDVLGFVNIEIHNKTFLRNKKDSKLFYENILYPYKLLIEKEVIKKAFLNKIYERINNEK